MQEDISCLENVWVWRDDTECLVCAPKQDADLLREFWSGQSKPTRSLRSNHYDRNLFRSINNFHKLQDRLIQNHPLTLFTDFTANRQVQTIGLYKIKQITLNYIADKHLDKMLIGAVIKFDTCLSLCCFDKLLLCCIRYFHDFQCIRQYDDVGDNAYKYLDSSSKDWEEKVLAAKAGLSCMRSTIARVYSSLILCMGLDESLHHSSYGKRKTSKSQIDNQFYEAMYDYLLFGVWITFSRLHWEQIKSSIGTLFKAPFTICLDKTPTPIDFKHSVSVDFARIGRDSKGLIISASKHKHTRSKVMQVILPEVSSMSPIPDQMEDELSLEELIQLTENVGIIGSNLALFDPLTLEPLPERLRLSSTSFSRSNTNS
ncbi:hypothetical protein LOD99_1007 [Oopsacas minuta]|uniref:Uncharacterized protein n=1 Tax=Oopsacas minuta TaxID=111878 RepID=A0AAV7K2W8_9METZ|nr:hypothetical protein LOD99_1007 [Oopsacas minuta]